MHTCYQKILITLHAFQPLYYFTANYFTAEQSIKRQRLNMKVLANKYLYKFRDILPDSVELDLFDPVSFPDQAGKYDALFINTTTPVNPETLPDPGKLSFIATGSSGTDHLDLDYLHSRGIKTADAAGCNAKSVAEYVITAVICYLERTGKFFKDIKAGIVGVGHTGGEVSRIFSAFSIPHILYDPPKNAREKSFKSAHFDELKTCNLLTFHTPLTSAGHYPTFHLLNRSWFPSGKTDLIINAARGGVVDEDVVLAEYQKGNLKDFILDVWVDEPVFNPKVAEHALFATPHIAGYSEHSKVRASRMIIETFCDHAGIKKPDSSKQSYRSYDPGPEYDSVGELLLDLHPIRSYDCALRKIAGEADHQRARKFSALRTNMPLRYEYSFIRIPQYYLNKFPELKLLGIQPE